MLKRFIEVSKEKKVRIAVGALAAHYVIIQLAKTLKKRSVQAKWRRVAQEKQAQNKQKIALFVDQHLKNFKIKEKIKRAVLGSTINGLKKLLFDGEVTVVQILLLFIERTVEYGVKNNWIADVCFAEALEEAQIQDEKIQQNKQILYQQGNELFGIPVTIKDLFSVKGLDSTYGLASKCFQPAERDGNQVSMIRLAGGIVFAKTNVPQIGYCIETNNFVFGRGLNPFNPKYTIGGSSGGEGAMLAGLCSVIGLGNDIGGSIRFPAAFNGVYSYKPSTKRICVQGGHPLHNVHDGYRNLVVTNGPLARCTDDCALMMSVLLNPQHYHSLPVLQKDIYFNPRPWNNDSYQSKGNLRIGYYGSIDFVPSSEANKRAVQMAVEVLSKQGHTLVPVDIGDLLKDALKYAVAFASVDELKVFTQVLQGEEHIPEYNLLMQTNNLSLPTRKVLRFLTNLLGFKRLSYVLEIFGKKYTAYDFLALSGNQLQLQIQMAEVWNSLQLDAIISPLFPTAAFKHGDSADTLVSLVYAMSWNLFDYNAGVVPVTKVQENEQFYEDPNNNDPNRAALKRAMSEAAGLPVCVQVITQPFKDELCLQIMNQLEQSIKFQSNLALD